MLKRLEKEEQKAFVKYLALNKNVITFFAPMNENLTSFLDRKQIIFYEKFAKSMGKLNGVSDIVVVLKQKVVFVELKRSDKTKAKISTSQEIFLDKINKSNVCAGFIGYGVKDAIEKLELIIKNQMLN